MKFLSNAYTNPNTNPKILIAGIMTLNDRHGAFVCRYFVTLYGTIFFRTPRHFEINYFFCGWDWNLENLNDSQDACNEICVYWLN